MKKIIAALLLSIFLPAAVLAGEKWQLEENLNTVLAQGSCSGNQVRVDLFGQDKKNPIYTSGSQCVNGKFIFSDDLLQWDSLKDGEYDLVINQDKNTAQKVEVKRPVALEGNSKTDERKNKKIDPGIEEDPTFLDAFVELQKSILSLRERLEDTEYSQTVKENIGLIIDGLDLTVVKLAELAFSFEEDMESQAVSPDSEESNGNKPDQILNGESGLEINDNPKTEDETEKVVEELVSQDEESEDGEQNDVKIAPDASENDSKSTDDANTADQKEDSKDAIDQEEVSGIVIELGDGVSLEKTIVEE